jgi:hypothetical protein
LKSNFWEIERIVPQEFMPRCHHQQETDVIQSTPKSRSIFSRGGSDQGPPQVWHLFFWAMSTNHKRQTWPFFWEHDAFIFNKMKMALVLKDLTLQQPWIS